MQNSVRYRFPFVWALAKSFAWSDALQSSQRYLKIMNQARNYNNWLNSRVLETAVCVYLNNQPSVSLEKFPSMKETRKSFIGVLFHLAPPLQTIFFSVLYHHGKRNFLLVTRWGNIKNCWGTHPHNRKLFISVENLTMPELSLPFEGSGGG